MGFRIIWADGSSEGGYETTQECLDQIKLFYPDYYAGHDGDLEEGGDRTLVWRDEDSSIDDDGRTSVAEIRREWENAS